MPTEHARLSASAAYRWINCPGSIALSEQLPAPPSSAYADEGTLAHSMAEAKLRFNLGWLPKDDYIERYAAMTADPLYTGEMDEATSYYADTVLEHLAAAGEDAVLAIEQRLDLSEWVPGGFGTSDAVIIGGGCIEVIDLKYGKGVKVEARNNPQLRLYALGAAALFSGLYDFSSVRTTIIQPRLDHISTEEMPLSELQLWGNEDVKPRAVMAAEGTDYTAAGDWCRWCPAKAVCRTRADENLKLLRYEFAAPALLLPDEIGDVLRQAEDLQKWAADVKEYAMQQAMAGKHIAGWKLVEGRSVRKYADELKVAERLIASGIEEAMIYERRLLGLTELEKAIGKKCVAKTLGDLIVKPKGKPVLVPESDKRPAISDVRNDFD